MNRLNIFVLHRDGIFTKYMDIVSAMAFLNRTGRFKSYQIMAHKGSKAIFIEKIENLNDIVKELNAFANEQPAQVQPSV